VLIVKNETLLIAVFLLDHKLEDVSMDISMETRLAERLVRVMWKSQCHSTRWTDLLAEAGLC
jgi:hypothetical protein